MNLRILFFLLFINLSFGQNSILVDDNFVKIDLVNSINYYHDLKNTEDISTVQTKQFTLFNKSFPGLKNAKFWFNFYINNSSSKHKNTYHRKLEII
jgi:hypothetical protein